MAFFVRSNGWRRGLLVAAAVAHLALTVRAWMAPAADAGAWLGLDALGLLFLTITSALFTAGAIYAVGYLGRERGEEHEDFEEGLLFSNQPEAVFTGCMLLFLGTMSLVCLSRHLGLLWVAIEATTLTSAPLIYYHRHHRSLEAAWKYLLICSVGIALALLGNFFLAVAFTPEGGVTPALGLDGLLNASVGIRGVWLKVAFVFIVVGYGTKMGLAPMHTWLPDAHSESPSVVSALLSGALLNCAFLGILRVWQVLVAAGQADFAQPVMIGFGLVSMAVAAVFILGQPDYKRMLAYSSVEHMGILALGIGLGGAAVFGSLLHAVNHSLTKGMLFLAAGNILAAYRTKDCGTVRGLLRTAPVTGVLWVAGFLSITGTPPFGVFLSKFVILSAAFDTGRPGVAIAALALLAIIFIGMCVIVLRMAQGERPDTTPAAVREPLWSVASPAALGLAALALGLWLPKPLEALLQAAARTLGGGL